MQVLHLSENPNKIFRYADPIPVVLPQDHIREVDILDRVQDPSESSLRSLIASVQVMSMVNTFFLYRQSRASE